MRYGSVCSGIEAASVAWEPLGWKAQWLSEIEAFPSAVLAHHYPNVPNLGDMTEIHSDERFISRDIDLLVGGTPCQSFSVAGLRKGLDDPRGNLALEFLRLADIKRPRWVLWENVPGVFSSWTGDKPPSDLEEGQEWEADETSDFGVFLAALSELGYGWAYRVLDAQYVRVQSHPYAVPQRRRRVFVVGYLGDWRRAAAVLFESESMRGHPPPSRKTQQGFAPDFGKSLKANSGGIDREDGHTLIPAPKHFHVDPVAAVLETTCNDYSRADGFNMVVTQDPVAFNWQNGGGYGNANPGLGISENHTPPQSASQVAAVAVQSNMIGRSDTAGPGGKGYTEDGSGFTLRASHEQHAVAFAENQRSELRTSDVASAMSTGGGQGGNPPAVTVAPSLTTNDPSRSPQASEVTRQIEAVHSASNTVRRLTPTECERLQGFPDGYTQIPYRKKDADNCPDGPRYKALGNSMAVNVMRWIGERIQYVDTLPADTEKFDIFS